MALIGQYQQTSFSNPQNGQSPIDADVVRTNDNALVGKFNQHDNDATIHVQTGLLAARPAPTTPYAMYLDENRRLYVANGSVWTEVPYARLDAAGTNAFTNNVTIGGTLGVTGNSTMGAINAGAITATSVSATTVSGTLSGNGSAITGITVAAANVTAGTFGAGNYVVPGTLTVNGATLTASSAAITCQSVVATGGQMRGTRSTQSGAGGTVSFSGANHIRLTMTGNGTITLAGGVAGGVYTLEVLQDATGGRTVSWANVVWPAGITPSSTTTANRKDVFTFFFDGTNYLGVQFGANFASTA